MLFININPQDLLIQSYNNKNNDFDNSVLIEHRAIGRVIDYFIIINETPDEALVFFLDIIGHPTLPPLWSLGFHQCRWGYERTQNIRDIYQK